MAGAKSDDEMARTATAPGTPSGKPAAAPELGSTLGRYRLEHALGEGGMGVVHAAFDPDLERRVALKVLRAAGPSGEDRARERLLREARAMARLTHPNVVTVHEVGTASGRDYVAMELVEGETLAEWLRKEPRTHREIIAAFAAAGRGLAAAHAAGLVHRDFKPHNVLRRADGRICVTDFGLARGVDATGFEVTVNQRPSAQGDNTPSPLSGLTATGSVLGTPAYMAPEQWSGGTVGPAADQFAFCVGLWEALTGERPFRGATIDALKEEVARGPAAVDASKLPRRLRGLLRRGLDPDPKKRWPDMDALLAALARAERRPAIAVIASIGAIMAFAVVFFLIAHGRDQCAAPALDPAAVWSSARAQKLVAADQAYGADAIAADFGKWQQVRERACSGEPAARAPHLACLDGVLAHLDMTAQALAAVRDAPHADGGESLIDPVVCEVAHPPRIVAAETPQRIAAMVALLERDVSSIDPPAAKVDALLAQTAADPCASALARLYASGSRKTTVERKRDLEEADGAAQRCGDDRLIARVALASLRYAIGLQDTDLTTKLSRAEAAVALVMQPDLQADLDGERARLAERDDKFDEEAKLLSAARDGYAARGRHRARLRTQLALERVRELRGKPDELAQIATHFAQWRDEAVRLLGATDPIVREIDDDAANWQFALGDVAGAHARLLSIHRELPLDHPVKVRGRVVDETGAPVRGATVTAAPGLAHDGIGVLPASNQRSTISRADGTFELAEAEEGSLVIAQLADKIAKPVKIDSADITLALAPTSRVEGRVDLRGKAPTNSTIVIRDPANAAGQYVVLAPVRPDGSFEVTGVPRGKMIIHTEVRGTNPKIVGTSIDITEPVVRGVQLVMPSSKRVVHVIVRSTVGIALNEAEAIILPGHVESTNVAALQKIVEDAQQRTAAPIEREHAPPDVLKLAKPGDVFATLTEVPEGAASACAIGLPSETSDPDLGQKIQAHLEKLEVRCVPLPENADAVVVEVPPFPRFD